MGSIGVRWDRSSPDLEAAATSVMGTGARSVKRGIDRVGPGDLITLATDHGRVPMNIAAILLLERGGDLDLAKVTRVLSTRIVAVRRLRQRLVRPPLGCGRPLWTDDPDFDLAHHLSAVALPEPGTRASLLEEAASAACGRLDPNKPLWRARLVTGLEGDAAALVIVMHHVLADGIGGLAVLAALADVANSAAGHGAAEFPRGLPTRTELAIEAARSRAARLVHLPKEVSSWVGGVRELRLGSHGALLAPVTSLNSPTGGRRRLTTVKVPRADIVAAAHRDNCTVNDLLVSAVSGAMAAVLRRRGEYPPELVVSVPVSARRSATAADLGNHTGVMALRIPTLTARADRVRHVAALTRRLRTAPRGRSVGPLAAGFRLLAAVRLFQPFVDHQRFVNTFVTNVRGPEEMVHIAGHRVQEVVPVAVVPGNVGISFGALSYGDQLVVTLVADPLVVPDLDFLTGALATELAMFAPTASTAAVWPVLGQS